MLLWGWRGTPNNREFLDHTEAMQLLGEARPTSDLSPRPAPAFWKTS